MRTRRNSVTASWRQRIVAVLQDQQTPLRRHAERRLATTLADDMLASQRFVADTGEQAADASGEFVNQVVAGVMHQIGVQQQTMSALKDRYTQYTRLVGQSDSNYEQRQYVLDLARDLGASARMLRGDERAFSRWFGHEAVTDRYNRRYAEAERYLGYCLETLGGVIQLALKTHVHGRGYWRELQLEPVVLPFLSHEGDERIRIAAFTCLTRAVRGLQPQDREQSLSSRALQYIYRSALQRRNNVWIQCEALSLLAELSVESLYAALIIRLQQYQDGDDLFVRRRCVELLLGIVDKIDDVEYLVVAVLDDPSSWVRQGLAEGCHQLPARVVSQVLTRLLFEEQEPSVRAAALLAMARSVEDEREGLFLDAIAEALGREEDEFVLRAAFKAAVDGFRGLVKFADQERIDDWQTAMAPMVKYRHLNDESLSVRRWAAQVLEHMWLLSKPHRVAIHDQLKTQLADLQVGRRRKLPRSLVDGITRKELFRIFSVLAQDDRGFDIALTKRALIVYRGHSRRFRLWRWWYEVRHPATDKRQAYRHTIGRIFYGTYHVPPAIMSELARTKVPGEPLFYSSEGGWRPYLPIVDELISAMDNGARPTRIYTAEGETRIDPPATFLQRLITRARITFRFADLARLRNWSEEDQDSPDRYVSEIERLGIQVRFVPHQDHGQHDGDAELPAIDESVARFFPLALPFNLPFGAEDLREYFLSPFENSLQELCVFLVGLTAVFMGRHFWINHRHRQARDAIPLVIGGWGTRGKSGTERIKAALLNALGYSIVSKTTGCEAMFLYSYPYGTTREMYLFRPYDKATIWEQTNIVQLSAKLNADCFIWECMGLTPSYVDVLQRQWMCDDIGTITNTYPDHEDVQGPAGIDVSEVMINFIPPGKTLVTTEEQMLPVLLDGAKQRGTEVAHVGWLEAGLITPDVIARFPYEEHPYNMALVIRVAKLLGVSREFALKEMADRVVADLGVLKTYPTASINQRRIEFINGCSANERFGCMNNWHRMRFADADPYAQPGTWITTVINNRADRVPRSKVFADMMSDSLYADRHFLIGTNLNGLVGFITESWRTYISQVTLFSEDGNRGASLAILESFARKLRLPIYPQHVTDRLAAMLDGVGVDDAAEFADRLIREDRQPQDLVEQLMTRIDSASICEDIHRHHVANANMFDDYVNMRDAIESTDQSESDVEQAFHGFLEKWFHHRIIVLPNPLLSGEQIIDVIARETPPGIFNRAMGMQNIKGTGLDFVYRWQAWERCYLACQQLVGDDIHAIRGAIDELTGFQEFGLLAREYVAEVLEQARHSEKTQDAVIQTELNLIRQNFDDQMRALEKTLAAVDDAGGAGFWRWIADRIEALLDGGDAVKRRKRADVIYRDLAYERIGQQQAVVELQLLTKRQKGGWLYKRLTSAFIRKKSSKSV